MARCLIHGWGRIGGWCGPPGSPNRPSRPAACPGGRQGPCRSSLPRAIRHMGCPGSLGRRRAPPQPCGNGQYPDHSHADRAQQSGWDCPFRHPWQAGAQGARVGGSRALGQGQSLGLPAPVASHPPQGVPCRFQGWMTPGPWPQSTPAHLPSSQGRTGQKGRDPALAGKAGGSQPAHVVIFRGRE